MGRLKDIFFSDLKRPPVRPAGDLVRYRVIVKYLGGVLFVLSLAHLATALASFVLGEGPRMYVFYLVYSAASGALGWFVYRSTPEKEVTAVETAAVGSLSYLTASVAGAVPFVFAGGMPPVNAWFEAMSGYTTTGFSLLDVSSAPASVLFLRSLAQWLGGLGFVAITVSLLLATGRSAVTLMKEELPERVSPSITRHVHVIVKTYSALTAAGVIILLLTGVDLFDALCYTMAGISTGGFTPDAGSVGELDYRVAGWPMMLIMLAGAVSLIHWYRCAWTTMAGGPLARVRAFVRDPQVRLLLFLTGLLWLFLYLAFGRGGYESALDSLFLAVSAQSTTGYFVLEDAAGLAVFPMMVIIPFMLVGGSMGSTAGGLKLFRFFLYIRSFNRHLLKEQYPEEAVIPGGVPGKGVTRDDLILVFFIISTYVLTVAVASLVFVAAGYPPLASVFEVTSAVGTVGLSSGVVSRELAGPLKAFLALLMWAGRLEFIPILVWFYSISVRSR